MAGFQFWWLWLLWIGGGGVGGVAVVGWWVWPGWWCEFDWEVLGLVDGYVIDVWVDLGLGGGCVVDGGDCGSG